VGIPTASAYIAHCRNKMLFFASHLANVLCGGVVTVTDLAREGLGSISRAGKPNSGLHPSEVSKMSSN